MSSLLLNGYFLERSGPSSTEEGSRLRIMPGTYNIVPHNTTDHPNTFELQLVPGRSGILILSCNYPRNSTGCLLPGGTSDVDYVGSSGIRGMRSDDFMGYLRDIHTDYARHGFRIIINDIQRPRFRR